ncbi:kinase-like domain-containing protein [Rhizophagus irregularis DAOM 181602=DAOM 197198]|uniref:Kinase-like domain-containing protein n=1 Tax=Rhizophagus irregularis (strain DAOM 181602 / DAOM 197198 / MUCL 43194) TaxID=747089 RepID=A0A2P4QHP9_RHIID|nr:kinase-like domain-containing protein [Rhizophagus irregularis DAOM 181602=DAOM 197198]POG77171.1 kinase-like domain-containing protein [Rhizophagus irregularis DAOM 181602=DAOM 197198]|eukprot:XP_025184037.1 kinase-like domain-containing protein [Rhizophagus irregularis DAOM 181602=DAOM 197198]
MRLVSGIFYDKLIGIIGGVGGGGVGGGGGGGVVLGLSKFGKSGNAIIDDFILEKTLRWIPYNKFKNVEHLSEGGFGTIYRAIWLKNNGDKEDEEDEEVILKCPKNLNENLNEFLKEWEYHTSVLASSDIINVYVFTKDPNTSKYMVVMEYANKGNLRENLTTIVENNWNQKLYMLYEIISGLNKIHGENLIHCDFHDGNILNHNNKFDGDKIYISDLGLCQPVKSFLKKYDIYGVIPFMAPEVLRGKSYTPASDIYSFSMIMWELTSGIPPFNNRAHDLELSLDICRKGERPEIIENTPQCYVDLMKKCWNEDPLKRPASKEVLKIIKKWIFRPYKDDEVNDELKSNIMEFINAPIGQHNNLVTQFHPKACYTSRLLDFTSKKLNEILESENLNDCVIKDLRTFDENIIKLNEILESEDSQASVKTNEILVSENLSDCIIKNLGSSDIKTDEN